jgi:hypothetical protein
MSQLQIDVNCQFHSPAALPPWKESHVRTGETKWSLFCLVLVTSRRIRPMRRLQNIFRNVDSVSSSKLGVALLNACVQHNIGGKLYYMFVKC